MATSVISALRRFTSCDVGDALVKLKVPHGGYLHGLKMFSPLQQAGDRKVFGPAYTVQMARVDDADVRKPPHHFVDGATEKCVVFISQPEGMYSACWGGLMSTRARYLGAQGVVIDGNFRDLGEHRSMEFPVRRSDFDCLGRTLTEQVFARATSSLGSNTFTQAAALNVPVKFSISGQKAPVIINPGDYVMADADGVVVLPLEKAEECLKLCEDRSEIDERTMACLKIGQPMGPTIARLRK